MFPRIAPLGQRIIAMNMPRPASNCRQVADTSIPRLAISAIRIALWFGKHTRDPERGALSQVKVLRAGGASSARRHQTVICLIARSHDHQQQHQKLGDDHCGGQESDLVAVALSHLLGSNRGTRGKNRDYGNVNVLTICGSR